MSASRCSIEVPEAYISPQDYLKSPKFHHTISFTPSGLSALITASYALCGSTNPTDRVVLWINGLGHHRIAAGLFDGLFAANGIRLLTIDRPSSGQSTAVEPSDLRVRVCFETILAVLDRHEIRKFTLLSHSNGIIYALSTLVNLPRDRFECTQWLLTSPWVPPPISGSVPFGLASYLPAALTNRLGGAAASVQRMIGPLGWSMGIAKDWVGWSAGMISAPSGGSSGTDSRTASTPTRNARKRTPLEQIQRFEAIQMTKPVTQRTFGGRYYPSGLLDQGLEIAIEEGLEGMGVEAIMSLRKGVTWDWFEGETVDTDAHEVYERGFERLKRIRTTEAGFELDVKIWYAGADGMIPKKGREWFKQLLVDRLGIVGADRVIEIPGAGHDEILGLQVVVDEVVAQVKRDL
ncbi:alpha/beta fold hydrolase [Sporobolomyces koalae]|uniref:alpha/beta fold hydrolase n=1 Tax=Sporobolomyces koalae TaxID=500713 RepID=UPI003177F9A7